MNTQSVWPPLTGVGHYTRRIALGVAAADGIRLSCFRDRRLADTPQPDAAIPDFDAPSGPVLAQVPPWERTARESIKRIPGTVRLYLAWKNSGQRRALAGIRDALYHEPNHILEPLDLPAVVTVHDLSTLHHPDWHPAERIAYFEAGWRQTVERARHIIAVSETTRRDVIDTLGVAPERVTAVPNGVSGDFRPMAEDELCPALALWGLVPGRYILSVGTVEPRKNLKTLLRAYLGLPEAFRRRFPLVLAGPMGWGDAPFRAQLEALIGSGRIRHLGYVGDWLLPPLYAGAAAFAYPSIYEGFGLPVIEAMAAGTPVVTSRDTAMAEVGDMAVRLIAAKDVDALRESLMALVEPGADRAAMIEAGLARAQGYGWDRSVAGHLDVFRAHAP